jgi:Family of unknown function (DUF5309)
MPPLVGLRGTLNVAPEQAYIEMSDKIKMLVPDETPFTTFLQALSKQKTGWPEYKGMEDDVLPRFDAVVGAGGTAVTFNVAVGTKFQPFDVIIATRTGEQMVVQSIAGNALTVLRGGTPVALVDADEVLIAGSAVAEGWGSRAPLSVNPVPWQNYTQILRRSWELTGTAYASQNETDPHDWDYQAAKVGIEHKRDIERTLLFNGDKTRTISVTNGQPIRTTAGLFFWIKTNQMDAGGGFSEDEFNVFSRTVFRYGSKRKVLMGSPLATSVLNTFPMSKVRISQTEKKYGINVTTFVSPFGELGLVTNWEFEGAKYGGCLVAYDQANLKYRYLQNSKANRDSHVRTEIQAPDADTRRDEWMTEMGLEVNLEKTAGVVTGITGAA